MFGLRGFLSITNLKTAPVPGDNFSSGTSSRSSKLIHGGVRYLQKAITKLDYKQHMLIVSQGVHSMSCSLKVSLVAANSQLCFSRLSVRLHLVFEDLWIPMYCKKATDRCDISVPTHFHTTSHRLGVTHIPLLWSCPPAAGQHDDARMNLAIALTAARYGAAIANYTEVVHLLKRADPQTGKERVCGAHCGDVITGQEFDVRAKCVINATGPFTDALRKMDDQKNPDICQPSAGVPIVIPSYYSSLASTSREYAASGHKHQAMSGSSDVLGGSEQQTKG
ncbi:putative glycerol-3-phosphate dehydrogenase mitochondrial [Scophthalmus maximus]|uniref:glycerol-3-phosphate dehydrogenase n=1 Tax=Scophthalmus maximus TaxID=52904 RepID=A0A2U9C929_SCOMX|nr:putative glycerol-3-phosphate dehydrogenase mitochondrial [Scophthalmus maximus]